MKVVFAAGGTGGHIQPAIALANQLKETHSDAKILFLSDQRSQEKKWISDAGFESMSIRSSPFTGSVFRRAMTPVQLFYGVLESFKVMHKFCPDVVIGFGGYPSIPPLIAGLLLGKPRMLLEQNVIPGRSNRLLAKVATEVHSQWKESRSYFGKSVRFCHSGNPIHKSIVISNHQDRENRCSLLVMGGSQGCRAINQLMMEASESLGRDCPDLEILHLAGPQDVKKLQQCYKNAGLRAKVYDYMKDMNDVYKRAGLAISRAGGTTIAELMAAEIPAILIPYPHATEDHQTKNAQVVESHGAGLCFPEKEIDSQKLAKQIKELFNHPETLNSLRIQTRTLAIPDAGKKLLLHLWKLANRREAPH